MYFWNKLQIQFRFHIAQWLFLTDTDQNEILQTNFIENPPLILNISELDFSIFEDECVNNQTGKASYFVIHFHEIGG